MLTLYVLGSGSGRPSARRDTTSLLVRAAGSVTLVDCPGSVVHKLARRGVGLESVDRVVVTHEHVDHVYGWPHLVHAMGVQGACPPLEVYAPAPAIATLAQMLELHGLTGGRYPEVRWHEIGPDGGLVFAAGELRVRAAPARHSRPTVALRFEVPGTALVHSSDTRACPEVTALARGAELLLHDCGGSRRQIGPASPHASAYEAGEVAAAAGVSELRLIHLSGVAEQDEAALVAEAKQVFAGRVSTAFDGEIIRLPGARP